VADFAVVVDKPYLISPFLYQSDELIIERKIIFAKY